jgi:hypothetical protein
VAKRRRRVGVSRAGPARSDSSGDTPKTYTISIAWNPMPPGVERVGARVVTCFVDEKVNWADRAMNEVLTLARSPPPAAMAPGKCRVLLRTAFVKMGFKAVQMDHYADGRNENREILEEPLFVDPHDAVFERLFSEEDPLLRVDRAMMIAEHVRNYLAYSSGMPLPLVGACVSREFLLPFQMDCPPQRYGPELTPDLSDLRQSWYRKLDLAYERTRRLIDLRAPDEPLARAISLVGEAIWTPDAEERFFYAWRALEVIGNADLRAARRSYTDGKPGPAQPYLARNADALLEKGQVKLDPLQLVEVSIAVRAPDLSPNPAGDYYDLRNAIAHGDVPLDKHLAIVKRSGEIVALAYRLTESTLSEQTKV